jgi:hypothetical protein|tara:strand:- start:1231 stop:1374 length:144 start_codon:yes stop_codon:yes gene_type:complete
MKSGSLVLDGGVAKLDYLDAPGFETELDVESLGSTIMVDYVCSLRKV